MGFKIQSAMFIFAIMSLLLGCQSADHEIIIVPKNYEGYIVIIYDQKNGIEKQYIGRSRLYNIPSDGVLLTQFSNNPGWSALPKFYIDSMSGNNEIPFVENFENIPENRICAFGGASGSVNKDLAGNRIVRYKHYYVGNKNQIRQFIDIAEKIDIVELTE